MMSAFCKSFNVKAKESFIHDLKLMFKPFSGFFNTVENANSLSSFNFQGWTTDPGRDAQLEYRLSIYHARTNDTGTYTCKTPTYQSHSVDIIVKEVK